MSSPVTHRDSMSSMNMCVRLDSQCRSINFLALDSDRIAAAIVAKYCRSAHRPVVVQDRTQAWLHEISPL